MEVALHFSFVLCFFEKNAKNLLFLKDVCILWYIYLLIYLMQYFGTQDALSDFTQLDL